MKKNAQLFLFLVTFAFTFVRFLNKLELLVGAMSVRRSQRSNKGVHTKLQYEEYTEPASNSEKPAKPAKISKAKANSHPKSKTVKYVPVEDESVRCLICGTTDLNYNEDEDDHGLMIECINCHTWQHANCMFKKDKDFEFDEKDIPDDYKCDVCDPDNENYSKLKRKMTYARYLKLRIPDFDAPANDNNDDSDNEESQIYYDNDKSDEDFETGKRNLNEYEDDNMSDEGDALRKSSKSKNNSHNSSGKRSNKRAKTVSSPEIEKNVDIKPTVVSNETKMKMSKFNHLTEVRSKTKKGFENRILKLLTKHKENELFKNKTIEDISNEWAIVIEEKIFQSCSNFNNDQTDYYNKARSLIMNFSASNLIDRVVSGEFKIEQLPDLTTEEMRSEEEKKIAEEAIKKGLDQVILKNDENNNMPKIRITHRGEEIIGDEDAQFVVNDKRIGEADKMKEKKMKEEEKMTSNDEIRPSLLTTPLYSALGNSHEDEVSDGEGMNEANDMFYDNKRKEKEDSESEDSFIVNNSTHNDTSRDILNDDDFDSILNDKINSNLKNKVSVNNTINEVFENKQKNEIPSKKDIWEGEAMLNGIEFKCKLNYISSTSIHNNNPKKDISNGIRILKDMDNANNTGELCFSTKGRLQSAIADDYLYKITQSRDLYLYEVLPKEEDVSKFNTVWETYHSNSRYGVLNSYLKYIKDVYLLSLSKEKLIDVEEFSLLLNKFNSDDIISNFEDKCDILGFDEDKKMYIVMVSQRNLEQIKPVEKKKSAIQNTNVNSDSDMKANTESTAVQNPELANLLKNMN